MKSSRIILILLTICLADEPGVAQWSGGPMREFNFNNPMSALACTMVLNKAREDTLARSLNARRPLDRNSANRAAPGVQEPSRARFDESGLRFRSTGTHLKTKELSDQLSSDPAQREMCLKIMNGVLELFGQQTQRLGLPN